MSWRPHNETKEDLEHEMDARIQIAEAWACSVSKLSDSLYGIDWVLHKGDEIVGFGEFKDRRVGWKDHFGSVMISMAKIHKLCQLERDSGHPSWFFVRLTDGLRYCRPARVALADLRVAGNERGQNGDIEPCYFIPLMAFMPVVDVESFA